MPTCIWADITSWNAPQGWCCRLTASTVAAVPASVFNSTRTLATHMYLLSNEGLHINETYGTAVVLLILVLLINSLSSFIAGRLAKK